MDCQYLSDRHNEIMDLYEATYDYPEYKVHVTLSYDIGDIDIKDLKIDGFPKINIVKEYYNELILDWQNKKKD